MGKTLKVSIISQEQAEREGANSVSIRHVGDWCMAKAHVSKGADKDRLYSQAVKLYELAKLMKQKEK